MIQSNHIFLLTGENWALQWKFSIRIDQSTFGLYRRVFKIPNLQIIRRVQKDGTEHTIVLIWDQLVSIFDEYEIQDQVVSSTTDNGSNFVKCDNTKFHNTMQRVTPLCCILQIQKLATNAVMTPHYFDKLNRSLSLSSNIKTIEIETVVREIP